MTALIALAYTLHLIAFPAGLSMPQPLEAGTTSRPDDATIGANGSIAAILGDATSPAGLSAPQRLLIVRSDGSTKLLRAEFPQATHAFAQYRGSTGCLNAGVAHCPYFSNVTLARDGTPFVTLRYIFSGAYSGTRNAGFVWDGQWHAVPDELPFHGLVKPTDPRNVSIVAADMRNGFAFVSDYFDLFPMEDLDLARTDPRYMTDVSGVALDSRLIALGIGDATAMRGRHVAGFDGGIKLVPENSPPTTALRWDCVESVASMHPCARVALGPGVAYGVDSGGDVVGDDEATLPDIGLQSPPFYTMGRPTLWRGQTVSTLSSQYGAAYAIADDGTIVGTERGAPDERRYNGFVADARATPPRARPLDPLVTNLWGLHILGAFGISDDGRILVLVIRKNDWRGDRKLGVLIPRT